MQNGLRKEINDVVVKYLKRKLRTGEPIDVAEMADEMAQSFVDMITEQDEEQQVECAPDGGQFAGLELTGAAGLSEDESHGQAPHPQHRVQTADRPGLHCRRDAPCSRQPTRHLAQPHPNLGAEV
jgi:hypothetical protein